MGGGGEELGDVEAGSGEELGVVGALAAVSGGEPDRGGTADT